MELEFSIIQPSDLEAIFSFEETLRALDFPDEMERMIASWSSRSRKEALEHYIPNGWCFKALNKEMELQGYFLAQPILFMDGQTQTLWVEHVRTKDQHVHEKLCEIAYKLGREKHLQRVFFPNDDKTMNAISAYKPQEMEKPAVFVKTTKG